MISTIVIIIGIIIGWLLVGYLVEVSTNLSDKGGEDRLIFAVVLWPIALIIRVSKFIFVFVLMLISGFVEEIRAFKK